MKGKRDETINAVVVLVAAIIVSFFIGAIIGKAVSKGEIRREAIRAGVALWVEGEKGYAVFQWITEDKGE